MTPARRDVDVAPQELRTAQSNIMCALSGDAGARARGSAGSAMTVTAASRPRACAS